MTGEGCSREVCQKKGTFGVCRCEDKIMVFSNLFFKDKMSLGSCFNLLSVVKIFHIQEVCVFVLKFKRLVRFFFKNQNIFFFIVFFLFFVIG